MLSSGAFFTLGADRHDMLVLALGAVLLFIVGLLQEKGHCLRKELAQQNVVLRWTVYFALIFVVIIFGAYGIGYQAVDPIYGGF